MVFCTYLVPIARSGPFDGSVLLKYMYLNHNRGREAGRGSAPFCNAHTDSEKCRLQALRLVYHNEGRVFQQISTNMHVIERNIPLHLRTTVCNFRTRLTFQLKSCTSLLIKLLPRDPQNRTTRIENDLIQNQENCKANFEEILL